VRAEVVHAQLGDHGGGAGTRPRRTHPAAIRPAVAGRRDEIDPLDEWVRGLDGRAAYVDRLGAARVDGLRPEPRPSGSVDYGSYR
ncbi:MAG TPA: hypothetical protein VIN32_08060, partial [Candidatus Limnocylindria bacterium]